MQFYRAEGSNIRLVDRAISCYNNYAAAAAAITYCNLL